MLKGIYDGSIDVDSLPNKLYKEIAKHLEKGLYRGFGVTTKYGGLFGGKNFELLNELRNNVYMFSAAKTYQEVKDMQSYIYDAEDNIRSFKDYYADVSGVYDNYNKNYAETEYNTTIASGQAAVRWAQIEEQEKDLPLLKLVVVEDAHTSDICEPLDGITLPVKDPFWDIYYPPNHWNCRSIVLQLDEGKTSSKADVDKAKEHADGDMQDTFRGNVGKDKVIFPPDHPYFKVPAEDKALAKENFNLPMPEPLKNSTTDLEKAKEMAKRFINSLSGEKQFVVKHYTGGAYRQFNDPLRYDTLWTAGYKRNVKELSEILDQAPKYEGTVHRGMGFSSETDYRDFMDKVKVGGTWTDKAFMSTTYKESVIDAFADDRPNQIFLKIKTKNGVAIESISDIPREAEILLNKDSQFGIEKVTTELKTIEHFGRKITVKIARINLKEL